MKIRLLTCIAFLFAIFFTSCKDTENFKISGTVTNSGKIGKATLYLADSTGSRPIDSVAIVDNKFEFKHATPYESLYKIGVAGRIFDVVVKNGDHITFSTDLNDLKHSYEISGSDPSEKIKEFNRISNVYGDKNSKLSDEYMAKSEALGHSSDSLLKVYMPVFQKNIADYSQEVLKFVDANKHSLAGFYAAASLDPIKYEQQLIAYADDIKDDLKENPDVARFKHQMERAKPISVGHKAPEFAITSIDGKEVKLSDYKGKYVMLDFWASWCMPCRKENPNVVKQFGKFHSKGFNILGISLDVEKKNWASAIKSDGLTWAHVSDLQNFEGPTERLYQVEAIPSNFIIDPQGNIAAKNITGADLEAFLNKTFN
ncbi:TlpA disulfide reductase family protein [Mucilaginibacter sp.]|uniref:TlpA disulfide reductase family protein n=1 Tax=Mucilaginibacter sp. TaxID=1882438 RepID=UPI003266302B